VKKNSSEYWTRAAIALRTRAESKGSHLHEWTDGANRALRDWLLDCVPCKPALLDSLARELDESVAAYGPRAVEKAILAHHRGGWINWHADEVKKHGKRR